jgi:hypothetical protein
MKGFAARTLAAACLIGGLALNAGCVHKYADVVDPCYPKRYSAVARAEVVGAFCPQVQNGHVLDQTIWNWHFVTGSDELHAGGRDRLDYLSRRRPCPDPRIFLQTARDIGYDPADPEKFADARRDLDTRRVLAIQRYLAAQTAGRPMSFEVVVHDPAPVGVPADSVLFSVRQFTSAARGSITVGGAGFLAGGAGGGTSLPNTGITINNAQPNAGAAAGGAMAGGTAGGAAGSSGYAPPR